MTRQESGERHRSLGGRLAEGVSWTAAAQLASQTVTFAAGVLLARILAPSDFGVVAMALVYIAFVTVLGQTGFGSAIVYLDDVSEPDLCTMYWANLSVNVLLAVLAALCAPLAGAFFHDQRVTSIVTVTSLGLVIAALGGVQRTLLEKRLEFRRLARNKFLAAASYAGVALVLALNGAGVWSLVVGRLTEIAVDNGLAVFSTRWLPHLMFRRDSLRRLMGYGSRVWAGSLLYYGQENLDNLIVGRFLGAVSLGYYSIAFRLANITRWFYSRVVWKVMFASFSSGRSEPGVLRAAYLRVSSYSVLLAFGLCAGLALTAREFVGVVYGSKWLPAVGPLHILAIAAGIYCVGQAAGPALLALGKPGLQTRLTLVSTTLLLVGAIIGARWGTIGVAVAVLIAVSVVSVLSQVVVLTRLGVHWAEYARELMPAVVAVGIMAASVGAWHWLGQSVLGVGDAVWLLAAVAIGVGTAILSLVVTGAPHVGELLSATRGVRRVPERPAEELGSACASPECGGER